MYSYSRGDNVQLYMILVLLYLDKLFYLRNDKNGCAAFLKQIKSCHPLYYKEQGDINFI